jgi:glycosyltransferase involved in cell wall biosynthesis
MGVVTDIRSLSVAAPAYNEAAGIERVVSGWIQYLSACAWIPAFEIVVCDDGSGDATGALLDRIASADARVRPVHHRRNQGAAAALTSAIRHTTGEWVLLVDADDQCPIENLPALAAPVRSHGVRATMGVRRKQDTAFARFGSWASGFICNMVHGSALRDFNSAFKLVDGSLLRSLPLEAKGLNYSTEITSRLLERGVEIVEVEIEHRPRMAGSSSRRLVLGTAHRFLFVSYLALRQLLIRLRVIQKAQPWQATEPQQ